MNLKELNLFFCCCSLFLTLYLGYSFRQALDANNIPYIVSLVAIIGVLIVFTRHTYKQAFSNAYIEADNLSSI